MGSRKALTVLLAVVAPMLFVDVAQAYYTPGLGRFISRDPITELGFELPANMGISTAMLYVPDDSGYFQGPGGSDLYAFVFNDPVGSFDAQGLCGSGTVFGPFTYVVAPSTLAGNGPTSASCPTQPAKPPAGCTVPNPNSNPTPEDCCNAIKNAPCFNKSGGGVVCCNGAKVSCSFNSGTGPGAPPIAHCQKKHEDRHHDDVTCDGCPAGQVCHPPFKPGTTPPDVDRAECTAYRQEIKCLLGHIWDCQRLPKADQQTCKGQVKARISQTCAEATARCGVSPGMCKGY